MVQLNGLRVHSVVSGVAMIISRSVAGGHMIGLRGAGRGFGRPRDGRVVVCSVVKMGRGLMEVRLLAVRRYMATSDITSCIGLAADRTSVGFCTCVASRVSYQMLSKWEGAQNESNREDREMFCAKADADHLHLSLRMFYCSLDKSQVQFRHLWACWEASRVRLDVSE